MEHALAGVRVLDFTRVLAGPLCTMMLADLGADVIKIESFIGDETRQWGPPWAGDGDDRQSAYYLSVNRNKRSLALNLKHPAGQQIARDLASQSHIVVENFKPGQMAAFGLSYEDLKALKPALVYGSLTGYGQTGPYAERPGYDYVIQAMSGLMSITGEPEGEPMKVGVAISDVIAGLNMSTALLAALRHAERTGQGQHVDIALYDTQLAALVNIASNYLVSGQNPPRYGSQHANIVPYQTFQAQDGAFVVAVGNDRQFQQLCHLLGQLDLAQDERFATNPARVAHRTELIPLLQGYFAQQPVHVWVDGLLALGIPAGPIQSIAQALDDPHTHARDMIQTVTLPNGASVDLVASPLKLSATPPHIHMPPPQIGQHSASILCEVLGKSEDEIQTLLDMGVIKE
jgi:crotonobetainyl-CoA:carnitine CoA-transferase CaiB-like acyl-CoA transferase